MMAKDPKERYQNPIEVADALSEWAEQPINAPPSREMPMHCPLVQALAGPSPAGSGSYSPLARALFSHGNGVFGRSNGGSSRSSSNVIPSSSGSHARLSDSSKVRIARSDPNLALVGSASTARASAAPTGPLKNPKSSPPVEPASSKVVFVPSPKRNGLYILIGVLLTLLFFSVAAAAYYMGRGVKSGPASNGADAARATPQQDEVDDGLVPGITDHILTPIEARNSLGSVQTVQFRVLSVSLSSSGFIELNSEKDNPKANLAVRLAGNFFPGAGSPPEELKSKAEQSYGGKLIRVKGKIQKDERTGSVTLEALSRKQIIPLEERPKP
jgi:hypothetical protein